MASIVCRADRAGRSEAAWRSADEPLRLNSEPVPPDAMPLATGDHAARVAAAKEWLEGLCGDYAPLRRQFIAAYLRLHRGADRGASGGVGRALKPYDGLYAPDDFLWSALRPLPRGWVPAGDQLLPADMVFWDGAQAIAIELCRAGDGQAEGADGGGCHGACIEPGSIRSAWTTYCRSCFLHFWQVDALPSSPFRRPIPHAHCHCDRALAASGARASSPVATGMESARGMRSE